MSLLLLLGVGHVFGHAQVQLKKATAAVYWRWTQNSLSGKQMSWMSHCSSLQCGISSECVICDIGLCVCACAADCCRGLGDRNADLNLDPIESCVCVCAVS